MTKPTTATSGNDLVVGSFVIIIQNTYLFTDSPADHLLLSELIIEQKEILITLYSVTLNTINIYIPSTIYCQPVYNPNFTIFIRFHDQGKFIMGKLDAL